MLWVRNLSTWNFTSSISLWPNKVWYTRTCTQGSLPKRIYICYPWTIPCTFLNRIYPVIIDCTCACVVGQPYSIGIVYLFTVDNTCLVEPIHVLSTNTCIKIILLNCVSYSRAVQLTTSLLSFYRKVIPTLTLTLLIICSRAYRIGEESAIWNTKSLSIEYIITIAKTDRACRSHIWRALTL